MPHHTILVIDDEPSNRNAIVRQFEEYDYRFVEAGNGREGLDRLHSGDQPDLVLLDIRMPVMDGFGFLREYQQRPEAERAPVCVMTSLGDSRTRTHAVELGADDFITKPLDPVELETRIRSMLRISSYQRALVKMNADLERTVRIRTSKLQHALDDLEESRGKYARAYHEMIGRICCLSSINQLTSTGNHRRTGVCAAAIAWLMGFTAESSEHIALATQLQDIGMLALPERLRAADPATLDAAEQRVYYSHTLIGSQLFADSDMPLLHVAQNICLTHHARYDGMGYPAGLMGNAIPEESRILAIAQCIVSHMQAGRTPADNLAIIREKLSEGRNAAFDPAIVDMLVESSESLANLLEQCA